MANDLNQCQFIGRLGKDPEMNHLNNGDPVCNFSLAVGWKTKDKEGVEWVDCVAYRKAAELIAQYCTKGSQLYVSGRFSTRKWQDKEDNTRYSTSITVDNFQFLGSKGEGQGPGGDRGSQGQSRSENTGGGGYVDPPFNPEDEIPFKSPPWYR